MAKPVPVVQPSAAKVTIKLYDRDYIVACGPGEEGRLQDIVRFVDGKLHEVAEKGGNITESRLFMMTCLLLADELMEMRRTSAKTLRAEEDLMVAAVEHLQQRVANLAQIVEKA